MPRISPEEKMHYTELVGFYLRGYLRLGLTTVCLAFARPQEFHQKGYYCLGATALCLAFA
jgi:hypothetical protein